MGKIIVVVCSMIRNLMKMCSKVSRFWSFTWFPGNVYNMDIIKVNCG